MEYKSDLSAEKEHLRNTIKVINESLEAIVRERDEKAELLKELSRRFTSAAPEFYNDIPITFELVKLYSKMARDYELAKSKPYFGKIIFDILPGDEIESSEAADKKESMTLYIGKYGIDDFNKSGSSSTLVVDWRAAVSELYYSPSFGKTSYEAPGGCVDVDVHLKTSFDIQDGEILGIYDSDIMANDDLLIKYLSRNKDTVLTDIVATIQQDQNTIIRLTPFVNLLVQGVAGSGKTTVAIHRIAYLLYNYDKYLNTENIYVIASSKLFLNYITSMLPDLDVPSIKQGTLGDFLSEVIREFDPKFNCSLTQDTWFLSYDETRSLAVKISEYFKELEREFYEGEGPVDFYGFTIMSKRYISDYIQSHPRQKLLDKAEELDKLLYDKLYELKPALIGYILSSKDNPKLELFCTDVLKLDKTAIFEENVSKRYTKLVALYKNRFSKKLKKLDYLSIYRTLYGETRPKNVNDKISPQGLAVLMLIVNEIRLTESAKSIRHIVIDEAQDFSLLIYYCLSTVFNKANFTLVGDVMQNITGGGLKTWDEVRSFAFKDEADYRTLRKSYRNTIQISTFAKNLVTEFSKVSLPVEPVIRQGRAICFYKPENIEAEIFGILGTFSESGYNMNAIICRDEKSAASLYASLKDSLPISILNRNSLSLSSGNYIMALKDSKGLEFDCVILPDFDSYDLNDAGGDLKRVYVAVTRALHELHIFTSRDDIRSLGKEQ